MLYSGRWLPAFRTDLLLYFQEKKTNTAVACCKQISTYQTTRCHNPEYFNLNEHTVVRFEVFTAVTVKNAVLWDVAPCRDCVNRRFVESYCRHLQGRKIHARGTSVSRWQQPRDVGSYNLYTEPHPRRRHSSNAVQHSLPFV
jgi:hypothetical protein